MTSVVAPADEKESAHLEAGSLRRSPLRIGISTRALFDLREEHCLFERKGVSAYEKMQLEREDVLLGKGAGFDVVERLLALNAADADLFVEVILLSRNSPDLSLRAYKSMAHYGLPIKLGSFTSGRSLAPFVAAWDIDLFLSSEDEDVCDVARGGSAAARLGDPPPARDDTRPDEVRVAFDCDAVVFSGESDLIYEEQGLPAFMAHESANAANPMARGPFGNVLHKLSVLRRVCRDPDGSSRVRIALVTARGSPAHERVLRTLRAWGTPADEVHFCGGHPKGPILKALNAHVFFDDQMSHVISASGFVPAGLVPRPSDAARQATPVAGRAEAKGKRLAQPSAVRNRLPDHDETVRSRVAGRHR